MPMPAEVMCPVHMVPSCRLCNKPANADPHVTVLSAPIPSQVNPAVPVQGDSAPVSIPAEPKFSSPQAAKAMELAQAYETVSRCVQQVGILSKGLEEAKAELSKACAERDKIQAELMEPQTVTTAAVRRLEMKPIQDE